MLSRAARPKPKRVSKSSYSSNHYFQTVGQVFVLHQNSLVFGGAQTSGAGGAILRKAAPSLNWGMSLELALEENRLMVEKNNLDIQ